MPQRILILGGTGRIGQAVAADVLRHTTAELQLAGRNSRTGSAIATQLGPRVTFQAIDLGDLVGLQEAIAAADLVVHCAGPFHQRDGRVLQACIAAQVPYVDVSDHPSFTRTAQQYHAAAQQAGVTAMINTGIFPGISNSMVRRDVEALDQVDTIHLSYVVGGSGGAGLTVMRTTFLGLQQPFSAWVDGRWQPIQPYSDREVIDFPAPFGRTGVYWFDVPEAFTLPATFPAQTVITKFGSAPDFYNHLTWSVARWWPPFVLKTPAVVEFLSRVSYGMTQVTDRFSGIGVGIRSHVIGQKDGQAATCTSTLVVDNTAIAAGYGTGSVAQHILAGNLQQPGVSTVEAALPTALFETMMAARGVHMPQTIVVGTGA